MFQQPAYNKLVRLVGSRSKPNKTAMPSAMTRDVRPLRVFENKSLGHLPTELLVVIIERLSAHEIAQFQCVRLHTVLAVGAGRFLTQVAFQVSKYCRSIVCDTPALQYKLECYLADVLEEPMCAGRSRVGQLNAIRKWRKAWATLEWQSDQTSTRPWGEDDEDDLEDASTGNPGLDWMPSVLRRLPRRADGLRKDLGNVLDYAFSHEDAFLLVVKKIR